jgi:hypothetical protein
VHGHLMRSAFATAPVICLTLAKWETVSGRFGGYLSCRPHPRRETWPPSQPHGRKLRRCGGRPRWEHLWEPPSILRPPEVLTEAELAVAEAELKALQGHAFEVVDPESR